MLKDKSFFDFGYEKLLLEEERIDSLIQSVCSKIEEAVMCWRNIDENYDYRR